MKKPRVIIPTGLGINSHEELGYVFELAGAEVDFKLLNELRENPNILDLYQGAGLPGGFTMGDELGAGQSLANRIRTSGLFDKLKEKVEDPDFPIYCVCNWLQVLAKLDLFPVPLGTLINDSGKHETMFWDTKVNPNNSSVWLQYLKDYDGPIFAPISHSEGRIYIPEEYMREVHDSNLIAITYTQGYICDFFRSSRGNRYNPNGSIADIAGLGWKNNLVPFPHFERLHHDFQRPDRYQVKQQKGTTKGLYEPTYLIFKAAVDLMKS